MIVAGPPLLQMRGIEKSFGGVHALRGADFSVARGEIHALLGENGAGKSTLVKILAGVHVPDAGSITLGPDEFAQLSLTESRGLGIRVIYQELSIIDHLSVAQNLVLGRERHRRGFLDTGAERRAAQAALGRLGVALDLKRPARALRVAEKQLIEIARALAGGEVRLLLMDEPTASLGDREVERLFSVVRSLRDEGIAVVYISHKLDEVFEIADRITVLRDGQTIGTVEAAHSNADQLVTMMVGRKLGHDVRRVSNATERVVLDVDGVWTATGLQDITFQLHEGEVVGVYGLLGSGRTELARALFGADPVVRGTIRLGDTDVRFGSPLEAMRRGIGLVPEERAQGLFPLLTIRENLTAASPDLVARAGWLRPAKERALAASIVKRLRIRAPSVEHRVASLSGGNQQKVLVGRWLLRGSQILILDDPTAGIDVGAKDEVYGLIGEMTSSRKSVVMSSSELPELLALADRIIVLHEGRIAGILGGTERTERNVLWLAVAGPQRGATPRKPETVAATGV